MQNAENANIAKTLKRDNLPKYSDSLTPILLRLTTSKPIIITIKYAD